MADDGPIPKLPAHLVSEILHEAYELRQARQPAALFANSRRVCAVYKESGRSVCQLACFNPDTARILGDEGGPPQLLHSGSVLPGDNAGSEHNLATIARMVTIIAKAGVHEGFGNLVCVLTSAQVAKELFDNQRTEQWRALVQQQWPPFATVADTVVVWEAGAGLPGQQAQGPQLQVVGEAQLERAMATVLDYARIALA